MSTHAGQRRSITIPENGAAGQTWNVFDLDQNPHPPWYAPRMERRNLLQSLALGAIGVGCSRVGAAPDQAVSGQPPLRPPDARVPARRKNWVWIGLEPQKPPDSWKRDFARMRASGIDAIVPEIYNGRHAYFGSQRL